MAKISARGCSELLRGRKEKPSDMGGKTITIYVLRSDGKLLKSVTWVSPDGNRNGGNYRICKTEGTVDVATVSRRLIEHGFEIK